MKMQQVYLLKSLSSVSCPADLAEEQAGVLEVQDKTINRCLHVYVNAS